MKRLFLVVACFVIGIVGGWLLSGVFGERATDRTIAMSWGDGKYGKQFYGAQVYAIPQGSGYSVRARVFIGPGNPYCHDCGEIGRTATLREAVDRFQIHSDEEGLTIGDVSASGFHLPRSRLESHR